MSGQSSHVLVTGGAGYIGSHTCKKLAECGYVPVTYDNLSTGHEWAVKWGPYAQGDLLDPVRLKQVFEQYRPEAVIHFAAFSLVGESSADPAKYYRNNVVGAINLLEAMRQAACNNLVFSSTCAVYGMPAALPINEDARQNPINPYGMSKSMIEAMLRDYHAAYGIRSVSLRYFNAAGADFDGEIGECHEPETHLIPRVLAAALDNGIVSIFGNNYATPDGTCIRDYVHVNDLADAHIKSLDYLRAGGASDCFNLGNERGFSVLEVIQAASRVLGLDIRFEFKDRREGDPAVLIADAAKAKSALHWAPTVSDLENIIRSAWHWQCSKASK